MMRSPLQELGHRSLFRGSVMLLTRSLPVNAATFVGYEYIMEKCRKLTNLTA